MRGTKCSALSPLLARPDNHPSDADADVDLLRVQVEHPSSPQQSPAVQPPVEIARGDVSACKIFLNHMGLPYVQDHCGPCQDKNISECRSQKKGRLMYACEVCNKRKITCHRPHLTWALPMLGLSKGVVHSYFYESTVVTIAHMIAADHSVSYHTLPQWMENLEYKVDKILHYLEAFCPKMKVDPSTIPGLNEPPPDLCSASHSICSLSSPGLGVSSLALSDAQSNTSATSSKVAGPCE